MAARNNAAIPTGTRMSINLQNREDKARKHAATASCAVCGVSIATIL
jgi:hypothetical protein